MKKLIILLLFLPISIFSQVDLKNRSLTDSNLAILYIGIYNEIKITAYKVDSTFNIKSSNGKVIESDWRNNSFTVKPHLGTVDTLTLFQNGKLILSKIYELKRIPDPIAQLGNITDTTATIKEILSNPELRIILPNCNYKMSFRVISYSALLIQNSGDTLNEYNSKWDCKLP
nr:hypothetical protein [Bacteroidota bacterium]